MATTAATLEILVNARTQQATSSLRRLDTSSRNSEKHLGNLDNRTHRLSQTLGTVARAAIAAGAAYIGITEAKQAVEATTDLAKSTLTLKKGFGLTLRTASEFGAVLKARGADASSVGMAFNTLSRQVVAAKDGSDTAIKSFKTLGITQKELKTTSPDQQLFAIADGLDAAGRGADRAAAASALFGRGWKTVVPVLRDGSGWLQSQLDLANKYGAAFGGESVKSIQDLIQTERELKIAQLGLQVQFTEKIAPALIKVGLATAALIGWISKAAHWTAQASKDFAHWISTTGTLAETFKQTISILVRFAKLIFNVGKAGVQTGKWVGGAFGDILRAGQGVLGWFKSAWGNLKNILTSPFEKATGAITGFINDIIDVINTVLGPVGVHIGSVGGGGKPDLGGTGSSQISGGQGQHGAAKKRGKRKRRQRGGGMFVGGIGSGDKIPALLEPGEFVLNREAVAAVGLGNLNRVNRDIPRFQVGGVADVAARAAGSAITGGGGFNLPGTGSLPNWIKPAGEFVLDKVGGFIKSKLAAAASSAAGVGGDLLLRGERGKAAVDAIRSAHPELQPGISQVLATVLANTHGLSITSTTGGGHASGSYHYLGRAVDLAGGDMNASAAWIAAHMTGVLTEGIHNPNLSVKNASHVAPSFWGPAVWGEHLNHIHLAKQRGGLIKGYQRGGEIFGSSLNKNQLTTLAAYVGMPNPALMAAIALAESGGSTHAMGGAGDKGLWQIIPSTAAAFGIPYGALFDPIKNARGAAKIVRGQGLGAWSTYNSGAYRGFLGGQVIPSLLQRLKGGTGTTTTPTTGTKGTKSGKGAAGPAGISGSDLADINADAVNAFLLSQGIIPALPTIDPTTGEMTGAGTLYQDARDAAQAAVDAANEAIDVENQRRGDINDLLGSQNVELMQRYGVGLAQNPILGISSPGTPTLYDLFGMLAHQPDIPEGSFPDPNFVPRAAQPSAPSSHTHVHIHSKKGKGWKLEDLIDVRIEKGTRRKSRRGNRPLPGARGR